MKYFCKPIITGAWEEISGDQYATFMRELSVPDAMAQYEGWAFAVVEPENVTA